MNEWMNVFLFWVFFESHPEFSVCIIFFFFKRTFPALPCIEFWGENVHAVFLRIHSLASAFGVLANEAKALEWLTSTWGFLLQCQTVHPSSPALSALTGSGSPGYQVEAVPITGYLIFWRCLGPKLRPLACKACALPLMSFSFKLIGKKWLQLRVQS